MICFFFNDTATTEIYTLSLHDALPIFSMRCDFPFDTTRSLELALFRTFAVPGVSALLDRTGELRSRPQKRYDDTDILVSRSEEHTSELQSRQYLVCRLLLEKKKKLKNT